MRRPLLALALALASLAAVPAAAGAAREAELPVVAFNVLAPVWAAPDWYPPEMDASLLDTAYRRERITRLVELRGFRLRPKAITRAAKPLDRRDAGQATSCRHPHAGHRHDHLHRIDGVVGSQYTTADGDVRRSRAHQVVHFSGPESCALFDSRRQLVPVSGSTRCSPTARLAASGSPTELNNDSWDVSELMRGRTMQR